MQLKNGSSRKKYQELINNTVIFGVGSFGSKIISFLLVPLYTNLLTTEQYGTADLVMTCSNIIVPIASLVIQDSVLRFGLSKNYSRGVVIKNSFAVFLFGIVICSCFFPLVRLYPTLSTWGIYLFVISVCNILHGIIYNYTKAVEKNKLYSAVSIIETLILAISNIILLVVLHTGVQGYLLANILANIIPTAILLFYSGAIKDARSAKFDSKLLKEMLKYSIPLIANNLSWWVLHSSDKVMIEYFLSASDLGLYTAASKIPNLLSVVTSIFSQAWTVSSIKEYDSDRDKHFYSTVFKYYSLIMFIGTIVIVLILKPFMTVYVGKSFVESWVFVPTLLVGTTFFSFGAFFGAIFGALKRNISVTVTTFVAATVNILINFLLIPQIGVMGASVSTAVSYIIIGIARMHVSRRYYKFEIDFIRFYVNSLIIIALTIVVWMNYNIYYCAAIALIIIMVINIRDIKGLFSWIRNVLCNRFIK